MFNWMFNFDFICYSFLGRSLVKYIIILFCLYCDDERDMINVKIMFLELDRFGFGFLILICFCL